MRTSFIKFHNFLLIFSVCITSNATDYKLEQLDEKTIYSNSEHELNSVYSDIK
ncbi:lysozyme inhibitor LprI family protein, partial [Acinetobacter baumannii]